MSLQVQRLQKAYIGLILFSILGSLLERAMHTEAVWVARMAGVATLIVGVALVGSIFTSGRRAAWQGWLLVFLIGTCSEICGLYTGIPFGNYTYSDAWWPVLSLPGGHFFPVLLPFAWIMIVGASTALVPGSGAFQRSVSAGIIAAVVDIPMEPVMTKILNYWKWQPEGPLFGAPVSNFCGWFLTAFAASLVLNTSLKPVASANKTAILVLVGHLSLVFSLWMMGRR